MDKYETLKQAGYTYIAYLGNGMHALQPQPTVEGYTPFVEVWAANKNHASYGLKYKNTHLEFCHSMREAESRAMLARV